MSHILAITIGPIFDTLQQARKTRELWAASYLYSQLMELLVTEIKGIGASIILPQKITDASKPRYGAGVYNDRLYATIDEANIPKVKGAIKDAIDQFAVAVAPKGTNADSDFWQKFLRVQWVHKSIGSLSDGAMFKEIEPLLNAAELHTPYFCDAPKQDRLTELLNKVRDTEIADALKGEAKGNYAGMMKGLFPSTTDLATFELFQQKPESYRNILNAVNAEDELDENQMDVFYEKIFEQDGPFDGIATDYHKYFCIVHADGDNLGALSSTLKDVDSYQSLSSKLSAFALDAAGIINAHGGKPVYIGGDDLLFFAPVCSRKDGKTVSVFQLIAALDKEYGALGLTGTTLSFGITLSYHKFPLFEARQLSYEQLAYCAKKVEWKKEGKGDKDAVAFRLLKHSGAYFEGVLSKDVLAAFVESEKAIRQVESDLISGIVFKMETLSGLFERLAADQQLETRIAPLFDNFFNEPIHQRSKAQIALVQSLLIAVYQSEYQIEKKPDDHTRNLYAILRLLKFVTDKPERKRSQTPLAVSATTSTLT